jgi:flagellar biogenesis protein FliO
MERRRFLASELRSLFSLSRSSGRGNNALIRGVMWSFFLLLMSFHSAMAEVAAPTTRPDHSPAIATTPVESQLIRRTHPEAPTTQASTETEPSGGLELPRVAGAMAIVIGLIFVLRWGGQRIFSSGAARGSSRTVQVLVRSPTAPRQQIMLVQVGKRVIVVGDSAGQMTSLCEITDSDEVAALVGQIRDEKLESPTRAFGSIFRRANREMSMGDEVELPAHGEETAHEPSNVYEDAAIAGTREEITGLMEKIRLVSSQLKSG